MQLGSAVALLASLMLVCNSVGRQEQCNRALFNEGCGPYNITKTACLALHCCYIPTTINESSDLQGPDCFYPINAEISAYATSYLTTTHIDAVALAGGTAAQKYTASQCRWGLPVLAPANRSGDTWGMGWDRLLEVELMDVETADAMEGYDIVFYGDSITESWRGTSGGLHWKNWDGTLDTKFIAADMRAVYLTSFAYKYRTGVMAIAGDQIGHLWWRMLNGQFPKRPPKVAVVLIGTNDLYAVSECTQNSRTDLLDSVHDIISRFKSMVNDMKKAMPGTQIIVQGLLPRGADFASGQYLYPNNFTTALAYLNAEYQRMTLDAPNVHYIYCGNDFLTPTADGIAPDVMPDGLHPNAAGLKLIAQCLTPLIQRLMQSSSTQQIASAVSTLNHLTPTQGTGSGSVLKLNGAANKPGYVAAAAQASFQDQQVLP